MIHFTSLLKNNAFFFLLWNASITSSVFKMMYNICEINYVLSGHPKEKNSGDIHYFKYPYCTIYFTVYLFNF